MCQIDLVLTNEWSGADGCDGSSFGGRMTIRIAITSPSQAKVIITKTFGGDTSTKTVSLEAVNGVDFTTVALLELARLALATVNY